MSDEGEFFFREIPPEEQTIKLEMVDGIVRTVVQLDGPMLNRYLRELEAYRNREPLVQALVKYIYDDMGGIMLPAELRRLANAVPDFKIGGE